MKWIANQPYYKVGRQISTEGQIQAVEHRIMYLYSHKIVTRYREFPLQDVFDLSFRQIGEDGGLLYLHTGNGVYSYLVVEEPVAFIQAFKDLVNLSNRKSSRVTRFK